MRRSNVLLFGFLSCFILTTFSCQKDISYEDRYISFDRELWPILENFEIEAEIRGFEIDLDLLDLNGGIHEIPEEGVAGSCRYSSENPNQITIDQSYWNRAGKLGKEFVVFHELGHCVLNRGHREKQDANGSCVSIMQSGLGSCRLVYNTVNRDIYLDELFLPREF